MSRRKFEMSKEELRHLYIEENMSDTEIAHMAGFKQWQVVMRLRQQYGIKKDRKSVIEKMKRTNVEKYGYTSAMKTPEYKRKIAEQNIEKYGAPCTLNNPEIRDKARETCRKNNGTDFPLQNKEILKKKLETQRKNSNKI